MGAPDGIKRLVHRYAQNREIYESNNYVEAALRQDFLDPMFQELGWDMGNTQGLAEHLREVIIERRLDVEGGNKAPDYVFRIGGITKFFLEAKKPAVKIKIDPRPAHQVRTYGWNGRAAYSVLCDFQEFSLYDTRIKPEESDSAMVARLNYLTFDRYVDEWSWIEERFHRDAVASGQLDRIAADEKVRKGSLPVDAAILTEIERWRLDLAKDMHRNNPDLSAFELSTCVQTLLDRVLFLRICEDRGIEPMYSLREASRQPDAYAALTEAFFRADQRYNSGLFHLRNERGRIGRPDVITPALKMDNQPLRALINTLYWPYSSFDFRILGAQVLGNVYEQFLGRVVTVQGRSVRIEEKPEVKKSGGVVYTPEMVVNHIVDRTLGKVLKGQTLASIRGEGRGRDAHPLRIIDPASGSGSFLIVVYQTLLNWYLEQYLNDTAKWSKGRTPAIFRSARDEWMLTTSERKRILTDHVFGVDIDAQAVEVTKLSLLLKVLENESTETLDQQLALFSERALPDLDLNIRCGNSLISGDYFSEEPALINDEDRARRINPFTWSDEFPAVMSGARAGFDVVVGNPPYVVVQNEFRDDAALRYYRSHYEVAAFKIDLYHLFIERCLQLVRPDGVIGLITPTNWMTNNHLRVLRKKLLTESSVEEIAVLDRAVFDRRAVDCAILLAQRGTPSGELIVSKYVPDAGRNFLDFVQGTRLNVQELLSTDDVLITGSHRSDAAASALRRIARAEFTLGNVANVNFGKQVRNRKLYPEDVISLDPSSGKVPKGYRACLTGSDVTRWHVEWSGLACTTDLAARSGGCWNDEIQDQRFKILCRQVGIWPEFGRDTDGRQCLNTMFMITPRDSKPAVSLYLLGVLNSLPLRAYWVDHFWDRRRTFPKIKGGYLKQLPVPVRYDATVADLAGRSLDLAQTLRSATDERRREQLARALRASDQELDAAVGELFGLSASHLGVLEELVSSATRRD